MLRLHNRFALIEVRCSVRKLFSWPHVTKWCDNEAIACAICNDLKPTMTLLYYRTHVKFLYINTHSLSKICCVLSCGSVLVLQFQKAPGNSKLISSRSILFFELLSLAEGGSKLSSLRIQPFLIHSFPAHWMDVFAECFRRRLYSQATNYWKVRKTKKDRLMTG